MVETELIRVLLVEDDEDDFIITRDLLAEIPGKQFKLDWCSSFHQGLEVMLPAFDGNDSDAAALHQDNLLTCNAVLVYYGAAPKAWVDIKLRELLKAAGFATPTCWTDPNDWFAVFWAPAE